MSTSSFLFSIRRRSLFALGAAAFLALACGGGGGGSASAFLVVGPIDTHLTRAALVLDTPVGFQLGASCSGSGFFLAKDSAGVYAMRAVCTYQNGQPVISAGTQVNTAFKCQCHGCEFDLNGGATLGPATQTLVHLQVTEPTPGGNLFVNTSTAVGSSVRI